MGRTSWTPGDGVQGALEMIDGPAQATPDFVPTVDQDVPVASYKDWKTEDTRIIQCTIGNDLYPGRRFDTRDDALRTITREHGRILEANYVPGRAFLRVLRRPNG